MSGVSSPPSGMTMDALLALAEFVSHPEYIDRVKELRAAQEAHDTAADVAQKTLDTLTMAQKTLTADKSAHEKAVAAFDEIQKATIGKATATEADLKSRSAALVQREADHATKVAADNAAISASKASLEATARALNKQSGELDSRKARLEDRAQDLERRFAKLKEAAS